MKTRHYLFTGVLLAMILWGHAAQASPAADTTPPPDIASYTITASYDPQTHIISAQQVATYHNRSDTSIPDLVLHLYLNAFSSPDTAWLSQNGGSHRAQMFNEDFPGWQRVDSITLEDGTALLLTPLDDDATLIKAELPKAVAPGESLVVTMEFTAQLPQVFARTGWGDEGDFVMAGQWFPKFGVWEDGAWNAYPFEPNNEFYADFGRYEVQLTLPHNWVVGSSGAALAPSTKNADGTRTHTLQAEHVIDFAWGASPHFKVLTRQADDVTVKVLHYGNFRPDARRVMKATLGGLRHYAEWYGPYGKGLYQQLTVIMAPSDAQGAGGMEYPTLFTVGSQGAHSPRNLRLLEVETLHELGHQWFQSVVASNEVEEPWLDEGFTDYSTTHAMAALYAGKEVFNLGPWYFSYLDMQKFTYQMSPNLTMAGAAPEFQELDYAVATYSKPILALTTLENVVGREKMQTFTRAYFERYAFAHPSATDVHAVMEETLGSTTADWFFDSFVNKKSTLDALIVSSTENMVMARRERGVCVPTIVEIHYTHGAPTRHDWGCESDAFTYESDPDRVITAAHIDPENQIPMDLDLSNNSDLDSLDAATYAGTLVRTLQTLQDFFWGGLGW